MQLYLTLAIIGIGIFLFIKDYFSIDTTSVLIMTLFIVTGVLNPEEGFSGFNHPATLTLGCMFVVSAGVFKSGIIDGLSSKIIRLAKIHYLMALIVFCLVSAVLSAFINDSAVVALLMPMALLVCKETTIAPSKLLIPISFAALFGGTCTLIGTSTNILVSSYAEKSGLQPFGMFEFSGAALCLLGIGMCYLVLVAPFLLPKREENKEDSFRRELEKYMAELTIQADCTDINKTIGKSKLVKEYQAQVLSLRRGHENINDAEIIENIILKENDHLRISISPDNLSRLKLENGYFFKGDKSTITQDSSEKKVFEVVIPLDSELAGYSLAELNFRNTYYCTVLAIRHRNETITENIAKVPLKEGDMMLLYASANDMAQLTTDRLVIPLSEYQDKKVDYKKALPALLIAVGVVSVAALGLTSLLISAMIGALLLVTTSLLKPKEAYEAIEWKVIFMMAGVLSMGYALKKTGGSEIISEFVFNSMGNLDPRITLSLIFLITFLSTNILSSKATAALMTPIVISLAQAMHISERPFLIAVMFACSLTFMTPVSYPTNTMVYAPGNYKFNDYLRVGTPLNILIWIAASFIIPLFFPF
jgi:di/tricarboxylate transporter